MRLTKVHLPIFLIGLLATSSQALADITFYTSESDWRSTVSDVQDFAFNAGNVGMADEVASPPSNNAQLGGTLTFSSANTGLSSGFTLSTVEAGAGFTFNDNEGSGAEWDDALSIGDIDNFENDDWQLVFDSGDVLHFGWFLQDNQGDSSTESFSVYDTSDNLLATFSSIPATGGIDFIGFTSTTAVGRVAFDEDAGDDDVAIGGIAFSTTAVPEPSSTVLIAVAATAGLLRHRKR